MLYLNLQFFSSIFTNNKHQIMYIIKSPQNPNIFNFVKLLLTVLGPKILLAEACGHFQRNKFIYIPLTMMHYLHEWQLLPRWTQGDTGTLLICEFIQHPMSNCYNGYLTFISCFQFCSVEALLPLSIHFFSVLCPFCFILIPFLVLSVCLSVSLSLSLSLSFSFSRAKLFLRSYCLSLSVSLSLQLSLSFSKN